MAKYKKKDADPLRMIIRKQLAGNIRHHRKAVNLTQMQLGTAAGIDLATVNRVERAATDTTLSTLSRIRTVVEVDWNDLLKGI